MGLAVHGCVQHACLIFSEDWCIFGSKPKPTMSLILAESRTKVFVDFSIRMIFRAFFYIFQGFLPNAIIISRNDKLFFQRREVGMSPGRSRDTLKNILASNGHDKETISYLKVIFYHFFAYCTYVNFRTIVSVRYFRKGTYCIYVYDHQERSLYSVQAYVS
jgi:hypothetical protein